MKILRYLFLALLGLTAGCAKLVGIDTPQNQLTTDKVFADTTSAKAAMVNVYANFDKSIDPNYNLYLDLYADELNYNGATGDPVEFNQGKLNTTNVTVLNLWRQYYFAIYSCNDIIAQLGNSPQLPNGMSATLAAEAKFLRAYSYFYLYNSFGPVPLLVSTDVSLNSLASRADSASIYAQINNDLIDAQNTLSVNYLGAGKVRANKWAAIAMQARVALYQRQWASAEAFATSVIGSGLYTPLAAPGSAFLAGSKEAILQFYTVNGFIANGSSLIPSSGAPTYPVTATLLNAFEPGDLRKTSWLKSVSVTSGTTTTTYNYPYKYHNRAANTATPEFLMALRVSEQYLIRAEARANQDNISGAVQDLNVVRSRAGLTGLAQTITKSACLDAINQEWRVEFCFEWGRRFLELRRTGRINNVLSALKPAWSATSYWLPIPQNELTYNHNLTQNPGY